MGRSWVGRGGGRIAAQPSVNLDSGPGMGSGRAGGQPSPNLQSGPGMGSGRAAGQPRLDLNSGAGMGSGRAGSQPNLDLNSGPGMGSGRAGSQPQIEAKVDFGEDSRQYDSTPAAASPNFRSFSSMPSASASGEKSPRVADPEGNFLFTLEIAGIEVAQFLECSGLKTSTEIFELQEGGLNQRVHKLPGQSRWENIVLRYGLTSDSTMMVWRNEILQDQFAKRRNGSIVIKTLTMEEVRRYNFVDGWAVSWEGPSLNANGAELAIESLEIAHSGIQVT